MQQGIVYFISNCILYLLVGLAVSLVCERRFPFWISFAIQAVCGIANLLICNALPVFSGMRALLGTVLIVLVNVLLHKGKWPLRFLYSTLAVMCMLLSEMILMSFLPRDASISGELYAQHPVMLYSAVLFVNAVVLSVFVVLTRMIQAKYRGLRVGKEWVLFLLFPISQNVSCFIFFQNYIALSYKPSYFLMALIVYLIADIALFVAIRVTAKNASLQARNEILEEEVGFQKDFYEQLTASYEGVRKMRHDIDNHLYTMRSLLAMGKTDEAEDYAKKVTSEDTARLRFAECGNMVAASYLEKKAEDFERLGISFETEARIPSFLSISNPDLICVLGNLLDNAQEACTKAVDPKIILKAGFKEPYLSISCRNTISKNVMEKKNRIPELERGIGTTILNEIAERYDGEYRTERKEGLFFADVILKNKESGSC